MQFERLCTHDELAEPDKCKDIFPRVRESTESMLVYVVRTSVPFTPRCVELRLDKRSPVRKRGGRGRKRGSGGKVEDKSYVKEKPN